MTEARRIIMPYLDEDDSSSDIIDCNKGFVDLKDGIERSKRIIKGSADRFKEEEFKMLEDTARRMCTQKSSNTYIQLLYNECQSEFEKYAKSMVKNLKQKYNLSMERDEEGTFLRAIEEEFINYKEFENFILYIFDHLDQIISPEVSSFARATWKHVHYELKDKVKISLISLIKKELKGQQIDRELIRMTLDNMGKMCSFKKEFEECMIESTTQFYSSFALKFIQKFSCQAYMFMVESCLRREKYRTKHFVDFSSWIKLQKALQKQLLVEFKTELTRKNHYRCWALKESHIHRMCRLYKQIPESVELLVMIFKMHFVAEGTFLVQHAKGAMNQVLIWKLIKLHDNHMKYATEYFQNDKFREALQKGFGELCNEIIGSNHIVAEGTSLVQQAKRVMNQVLIWKLIELHDNHMKYATKYFQNDKFREALQKGFGQLCNEIIGSNVSSELLAAFSDDILKKCGSEELSDKETEETLGKVVKLLAYVSERDLFAKIYRKKLACRLFHCSSNMDHEQSMVQKLEMQYGENFTSKMKRMCEDITLRNFDEYASINPTVHHGIDFIVKVVNSLHWPSDKFSNLKLQPEMVTCAEDFEKFCERKVDPKKVIASTKLSGRSDIRILKWCNSLGLYNIIGTFERCTVELIVSTEQAAILLLFNDSDRLEVSEISTKLNFPHDNYLVGLLGSLSSSKYEIFIKEPSEHAILPTDYFTFNSKFTSERSVIEIPQPLVERKKKVVESHVYEDSRYAIESAIVRIMKDRKVSSYRELVLKCIEQLKSKYKLEPDNKAIKKQIESAIERDYMKRDEKNPEMLMYLP